MRPTALRKTPALRQLPALVLAAALATTLAACTSSAAAFEPGDASSTVTATGAVGGSAPTVEFPTPLVTEDSQRSTLVEGEGDPIAAGDQVDFAYTVLDGASGQSLGAFGFADDGKYGRTSAGAGTTSLSQSLAGTRVGGRYALTTTAALGFGPGTLGQLGLADDATLVLVIDVLDARPGKSEGVNQLPLDGMPAVVTAVDGTPGITVPDIDPPTTTRISTIKLGSGPVVEDGANLVVHFSGWVWPTADAPLSQFQSTWTGQRAVNITASPEALVPGFADAVIGANVGDQVLAVIAPEDGYGDTPPAQSAIPAGATLIFVIDILGIQEQ